MTRFNPAFVRLRSGLLMLALLAVVLRGLVPMGFMPAAHAEAGTPFVICSGTDIQTIYLDEDGQPAPADASHDASSPCVFAFAPLAFEPFLPDMVPVAVAETSVPGAAILATARPLAALLPWAARAPPAFIA